MTWSGYKLRWPREDGLSDKIHFILEARRLTFRPPAPALEVFTPPRAEILRDWRGEAVSAPDF